MPAFFEHANTNLPQIRLSYTTERVDGAKLIEEVENNFPGNPIHPKEPD